MQNQSLVAIDPGKSGGIAWYNDHVVDAIKMYDTPVEIWEHIENLILSMENPVVYIEKVGFHKQGNNASSSVKFGRHVGLLEGMLVALRVPIIWVPAQTWMKGMGTLPKDRTQRKNLIKHITSERFRHLRVTLMTADALGILWFAMRKHGVPGY